MKQKLCDDIGKAFAEGKEYFKQHPDITAAELYRHAQSLAAKYGWEFGSAIAGHLVGQFPHERIPDDKITLYVHPQNPNRMRSLGGNDNRAIGFSKFTSSTEFEKLANSTNNCSPSISRLH